MPARSGDRVVIGGFSRQLATLGEQGGKFIGHLISPRFVPDPRPRMRVFHPPPRHGRAALGSQTERGAARTARASIDRMKCRGESMAARDEKLHEQVLALSTAQQQQQQHRDTGGNREIRQHRPPRASQRHHSGGVYAQKWTEFQSESTRDLLLANPRARRPEKAFPRNPRVQTPPKVEDEEKGGGARARRLRELKMSAPFPFALGGIPPQSERDRAVEMMMRDHGSAEAIIRAASAEATNAREGSSEEVPPPLDNIEEDRRFRPATVSGGGATLAQRKQPASLMCKQRRHNLAAWAGFAAKLQARESGEVPEFLDLDDLGDAGAVLQRILKNKNGVVGSIMGSLGR